MKQNIRFSKSFCLILCKEECLYYSLLFRLFRCVPGENSPKILLRHNRGSIKVIIRLAVLPRLIVDAPGIQATGVVGGRNFDRHCSPSSFDQFFFDVHFRMLGTSKREGSEFPFASFPSF
jgi:hypothetical protein